MSETLASLEKKREQLYKQLQESGDFRRGTISVVFSVKRQVYFPVPAPSLFSSLAINGLPVSS
jgi:hypothetical protein